jgi:hypothetical protein
MAIHRLSITYYLDDTGLTASSWWGLFKISRLDYEDINSLEVRLSFASRLAGCGHILVGTHGDSGYITLISQRDPEKLKMALERLSEAAIAKAERASVDTASADTVLNNLRDTIEPSGKSTKRSSQSRSLAEKDSPDSCEDSYEEETQEDQDLEDQNNGERKRR